MATTPARLRFIWIDAVSRICQTDRYHLSHKWAKTFEQVASWLEQHPEIDPVRFAEAQIHWCVRNRVRNALWPNLMSGPQALQRYLDEPDETKIVQDLEAHYTAQARAFVELAGHLGLEAALNDTMVPWSPLYLAFVRHENGLEISQELRAKAAQEASAERLVCKLFPEAFLRSLS